MGLECNGRKENFCLYTKLNETGRETAVKLTKEQLWDFRERVFYPGWIKSQHRLIRKKIVNSRNLHRTDPERVFFINLETPPRTDNYDFFKLVADSPKESCPICRSEFGTKEEGGCSSATVSLPCNHLFGNDCIR